MQVPIRYPKKNLLKRFFSIDNHFFSILVGLVFAGIFCTGVYVLAAYVYNPGDTLDPTSCTLGPDTPNCIAPPITASDLSAYQTALGFTPANSATTLTINGTTYDLTANRAWTISTGMTNPMAHAGAMIYGGTSGTPTELVANSSNIITKYLQSFNSGNPSWQQIAYGDISGAPTIPTQYWQTNGTTLSPAGSETGIILTGTGAFGGASSLTLGTAATHTGAVVLKNSTNINTVTIQSGATSASYALTLPIAQGASATNTVLTNDGSGTLSWAAAASNYWTQTSTILQPTITSKRVLIGGAIDDTTSALQVQGTMSIANSSGSSSLFSSDGTLTLGSNKTSGKDGAIAFDFETTAGAVLIASTGSGTAVNSFIFGGPSGLSINADGSIGLGAINGVSSSVVIGNGAGSGDATSVIIGSTANAGIGIPGSDNVVIGFNANSAGGSDSVAIGYGAFAGDSGNSIAIGSGASISSGAADAIVIGGYDSGLSLSTYADSDHSTVIGYGANDGNALGGVTLGGSNLAGVGENWLMIKPGASADSPLVTIGQSDTNGTGGLNVWGDINASGSINAVASFDIAEPYPTKDATLSAGEIVALDITNPGFVVRANSVNNSMVLGIVSTAPGMKLGADKKYKDEIKVPVALAGHVPVKVDLEGGAINIGDRITLSTAADGVGMKASAGENTFGIAMEPFDGLGNTDPTTLGTILVFVQNQEYGLSSSGVLGNGQVTGVGGTTFLQSVNDSLAALGITIKDGIIKIATLAVDSLNVKTARIQEMEIVDSVTGDAYCTWIANGEWQKVKGDCATVGPNVSSVIVPASLTTLTEPNNQTTSIAQEAIDAAEAAAHQAQAAAQQAQRIAQQAQHAAQQASQANSSAQDAADQAQSSIEAIPLNISSVAPILDINVAYGADLSGANLPTTIPVTLSDASTQSLAITWDNGTPTYDPNTAGTYVFSGTLTFSGNVTNSNNVKAVVNVIVAPQLVAPEVNPPSEEQVPQPISMLGNLIQNSTASFLNSILEFVKWIFGTSAKTISLLPLIKQATASLMQSIDLFQAGLIAPINKILGK